MILPRPNLCAILAKPLRWMPRRLHSAALASALNHLLADMAADGALDFLIGKSVCLRVTDMGIGFVLRFERGRFTPADQVAAPDVRFSGDAHTFLQLATQREDADSLFFRRLLRIEGDTATGLHLKNFLDALGEPALPPALRRGLEGLVDLYPRLCASDGATDQPPQLNPARPLQ